MPTPRVRFSPNARTVVGRLASEMLAARAVAGLTQRQVARRAGITQPLVSQIERGETVPSLLTAHRIAVATGHELSLRLWPASGVHLRDSGQLGIAEQIRGEVHADWQVALEVPVGLPPDRRAADMVISHSECVVMLEIERSLLDFQAQLRAAQLKRTALAERLGRGVHLVLAIPDARKSRTAVAAHGPVVAAALPVSSRRVWASLRAGTPLAGDGLLWVRVRLAPARER